MARKKNKTPFWLPINTETYRADTADLSTLEHGAFFLLRLHYWRAGPLKDNDTILARIAGLSASEWKSVRPALERFFDIDGEWVNWEWDNELAVAYASIKKASDAGIKANAIRWERARKSKLETSGADSESHPNRIRIGSESDSESHPNRYPNYKIGGMPPKTPSLAKPEDSFLAGETGANQALAEPCFAGGADHD